MTTAKLVTSPAEGHGLTSKITDPLYSALANKRPTSPIVAVVVLKPVGLGQRETKGGSHQHVVFEATHLEPVADANQANELRYLVQALYEQRTSTGEQRTLPLGLGGDEERRQALMERMEDWSAEQGLTSSELEAKWRETFGAGSDDDWSWGDQGVPGDYRKASVAHLTSFCYSVGVLSLDARLPHEDRDEAADDDGEDADTADVAETGGSDETTDVAAVQDEPGDVVGVKCQVCAKKSPELYDGLCRDCARNAGVPVLGDEPTNVTDLDTRGRKKKTS